MNAQAHGAARWSTFRRFEVKADATLLQLSQ